jgi:signal peptidase II
MVQTEVEQKPPAERVRPAGRAVMAMAIAVVVAVGLDVLTKELATSSIDPDEPVKLLGGALYLSLTRNAGAAFSLLRDFTFIFPIIATVVIGVLVWMARTLRSAPWGIALGLILGGAMGNLIDRIFRAPAPFHGHVVDFFSLFDPHGQVFPIFNVADMALTFGVILAITLEVLGRQRDGTRLPKRGASSNQEPTR